MPISVTIAGIDRTNQMNFRDMEVFQTIAANADVARMRFALAPGSTWRPLAGNEVILTNGATREFAGIVMEVTEKGISGPWLDYECQCRDYLHLFNKKLVATEYTSGIAASAIVSDIVALSTDGFSSTGVISSPQVPAQKYDYLPAGDIVRSLANAVNYGWWIDYNKVVNFTPTVTMTAPVAVINLDSKQSTDLTGYGSLDITESVQFLKNRVYIKGWKQKSDVTYSNSFLGDGTMKFFPYGYEISSTTDVTATINGVALSVGTDTVDSYAGSTIGSSSTVYICFDNLGARMNYSPSSSETLAIISKYMTPGFTSIEDTVAQSTAGTREGGDGIHEYAHDNPALTASDGSDQLAQAFGNAILTRDAYARITGKFQSYTQGWRAGQSFVLYSTLRQPPAGINKTCYIQEVRKRLVVHSGTGATPTLVYDLSFADGPLAR